MEYLFDDHEDHPIQQENSKNCVMKKGTLL